MSAFSALARVVGRKSLSKGWKSGNGALLALGGTIAVVRFVRRVAGRPERTINESIRPGESLIIEARSAERGRRRRSA